MRPKRADGAFGEIKIAEPNVKRHLFSVGEVWRIWGKGLILGPGVSADDAMTITRGSEVELWRPDGTVEVVEIYAIEYPPSVKWVSKPEDVRYGVIISGDIAPSEVPVGTEVYLRDA